MSKPRQDILNKLTKARTALLIDQPFFGTLAMRLKLIETTSIPTLAVDGKMMMYNPDFLADKDSDYVKSAVAHEVMHCVLDHCGATGRGVVSGNPQKFNWAADYVVNDMIQTAGFKLGDGWLYDPQYHGMTSEQIFKMIPDPPPDSGGGPGAGNPGPLDQVQSGTVDPATQQANAMDWKVAAVQAANAAKAVGKLHESLESFVDKIFENKVDWAARLRQFITQQAKNDYSYRRFNRKMQAAGHYLPGLFSEEMGEIVIASDESGSIGPDVLAAFGAEIDAIRADLRPEKITLMHFAVEMGKAEEFGPDDPFVMKQFCSGGTDFRPVMTAAENLAKPPLCMIYLTDLYGPFPTDPPPFPVLWVSVSELIAPFGETIHIELD